MQIGEEGVVVEQHNDSSSESDEYVFGDDVFSEDGHPIEGVVDIFSSDGHVMVVDYEASPFNHSEEGNCNPSFTNARKSQVPNLNKIDNPGMSYPCSVFTTIPTSNNLCLHNFSSSNSISHVPYTQILNQICKIKLIGRNRFKSKKILTQNSWKWLLTNGRRALINPWKK